MARPPGSTLARSLKQAGYATGHFGKWHMGGQRDVADAPPITDYGFDASLTNFEGMGPKLLPLTLKPGQDPNEPGKIWGDAERLGTGFRWMQRSEITGGFVDEAIPFIEKAKSDGKPFYVNLWPDDVHGPYWPPVEKWADDRRGLYLSVLQEMDRQLGKLFDVVRNDEALRENTLIWPAPTTVQRPMSARRPISRLQNLSLRRRHSLLSRGLGPRGTRCQGQGGF